jgi:beta-glucosidase
MNTRPLPLPLLAVLSGLLFIMSSTRAESAGASPPSSSSSSAPTTSPVPEPADEPAPKQDRAHKPEPHFIEMHRGFIRRGKEGPIDLLFLGDSITEFWLSGPNEAPQIWREHYWKYTPADFGISGDRTQNVLWRIADHELDGIHPKVVVLMIGTNNTAGNTAAEITAADVKIVRQIHEKLPETKLLLLGILPRGADPADPRVARLREKITAINKELAKLDDSNRTRYLDIGSKFFDAQGNIPVDVMKDALHPTPKGYQIWADAMQPLLDDMMR